MAQGLPFLSVSAVDAASVVNKLASCSALRCEAFFLCKALNTKVASEQQQRALMKPHYACMEKQTNKTISNASSPFTHAPSLRSLSLVALFLLFSTFLPLLGPLSLLFDLLLVQPVVETFFFFTIYGRKGGWWAAHIQSLKGKA